MPKDNTNPPKIELSERQAVWLFRFSRDVVRDKIREAESDLAKHLVLDGIPSVEGLSRKEKIQELRNFLEEYSNILQWAEYFHSKAMDFSAEQFARCFKRK